MGVISFEEYKLKKAGASASRPTPSAPISTGRARLLEATRKLHEAALKQHAMAREFLGVASELNEDIEKLEKSCVRFDSSIRRIKIKPLGRSAKTLADTMDSVLSTRRP